MIVLILKKWLCWVIHTRRCVYVPALVGAGDEKVVAGGVVRAVPNLLKIKPTESLWRLCGCGTVMAS
jgi:hypothetical protein